MEAIVTTAFHQMWPRAWLRGSTSPGCTCPSPRGGEENIIGLEKHGSLLVSLWVRLRFQGRTEGIKEPVLMKIYTAVRKGWLIMTYIL